MLKNKIITKEHNNRSQNFLFNKNNMLLNYDI